MNKLLKYSTLHYFNRSFLLLGVVFLCSAFYSCKSKKVLTEPKSKCATNFKSAKWLTFNLKQNEFQFNTFDAKLNVEAKIDSTENSFTVTMRIHKDSLIWMSISKLGIEAVRVLITTDSVSFVNRISKEYFVGDFTYLSKLLNTPLDYEILQSLLVGNSVSFYDDEEKIKASINNTDCEYLLGTIRKHKLKKVLVRGKELRDPAQTIYMDPESFKIKRILFYDFDLDRTFNAVFSNFEKIDSVQLFPSLVDFNIKAEKSIIIKLEYTKHRLNEDLSFSFKIPENYEQIINKEK